jgi:hypothetical protein
MEVRPTMADFFNNNTNIQTRYENTNIGFRIFFVSYFSEFFRIFALFRSS